MIFIISEKIKFNPEDGSLTHCATQETLKLTLTASRLLEALLKAPAGILSREQLLTMVWDEYGLQASNSSLNQYISILRRTLSTLGCEELIVTIPKMGFRLNADITFQQLSPLPPNKSVGSAFQGDEKKTSSKINYIAWFSFFSLLISISLIFIFSPFTRYNHYQLYKDRLSSGCEIIFMKNLSKGDREKARERISAILQENTAVCGRDKKVIFDSNDSLTGHSAGRTLFSLCNIGENKQIISCNNIYYHDWKQS